MNWLRRVLAKKINSLLTGSNLFQTNGQLPTKILTMKLKAVIFDLDGTLVDSIQVCILAFRRAIQQHLGLTLSDADIIARFGPNEEGMLQRLLPDGWQPALQTYLQEYETCHAQCDELFPGIEPLLKMLKDRGVLLGIVTGKGAGSARISSQILGLGQYFDTMEVGSAQGSIKRACIGVCLQRWGLTPQAAAYVGDTPADIDAARQAGVTAIAAAWAGSADYQALTQKHPDTLFTDVPAFASWALSNS